MKVKIYLRLVLAVLMIMPTIEFAQTKNIKPFNNQQIFHVSKAKRAIKVEGKADESSWKNTEEREFKHFYNIEKSSDKQFTKFRMLWVDEN